MKTQLLPILTDRLGMRRFESGDLQAFQEYRHDPEVAKYQGWQPTTDEKALAFLHEQSTQKFGADGKWLQIAVTSIDTRELIGDVGVCMTDSSNGIATRWLQCRAPLPAKGLRHRSSPRCSIKAIRP